MKLTKEVSAIIEEINNKKNIKIPEITGLDDLVQQVICDIGGTHFRKIIVKSGSEGFIFEVVQWTYES